MRSFLISVSFSRASLIRSTVKARRNPASASDEYLSFALHSFIIRVISSAMSAFSSTFKRNPLLFTVERVSLIFSFEVPISVLRKLSISTNMYSQKLTLPSGFSVVCGILAGTMVNMPFS